VTPEASGLGKTKHKIYRCPQGSSRATPLVSLEENMREESRKLLWHQHLWRHFPKSFSVAKALKAAMLEGVYLPNALKPAGALGRM
jgi:hypothetical protein